MLRPMQQMAKQRSLYCVVVFNIMMGMLSPFGSEKKIDGSLVGIKLPFHSH